MTLSAVRRLESGPVDHGAQVAALDLGLCLQVVVIAGTWLMGLRWDGATHTVAVVLGVAGLVPLTILAYKLPPLVLAVPAVSLLVSAVLYQGNTAHLEATVCTDQQLAAVATLDPPRGDQQDFRDEAGNGCVARYYTTRPTESVLSYYRSELLRTGWQLAGVPNADGVSAVKDGIVVEVDAAEGQVDVSVSDQPGAAS